MLKKKKNQCAFHGNQPILKSQDVLQLTLQPARCRAATKGPVSALLSDFDQVLRCLYFLRHGQIDFSEPWALYLLQRTLFNLANFAIEIQT